MDHRIVAHHTNTHVGMDRAVDVPIKAGNHHLAGELSKDPVIVIEVIVDSECEGK